MGELPSDLEGLREYRETDAEEPATPDLVELTHRLFEAGARGGVEAMVGVLAPDAVLEADALDLRLQGVDAIGGFLEDWLSSYEEYEVEPVEIHDVGNGVVIAVTRRRARLAGSAAQAQLRGVIVYVLVWDGGRIVRVSAHGDLDTARAAAERLAEERG